MCTDDHIILGTICKNKNKIKIQNLITLSSDCCHGRDQFVTPYCDIWIASEATLESESLNQVLIRRHFLCPVPHDGLRLGEPHRRCAAPNLLQGVYFMAMHTHPRLNDAGRYVTDGGEFCTGLRDV